MSWEGFGDLSWKVGGPPSKNSYKPFLDLHCNREPYRFSCKQDPSLHTDTETSSYFYITYFRADFWAYAGQAGLRQAISRTDGVEQADLKISFQTGRVDCPTAPYTDVDVKLPAVHLNYEDLVGFFADRYEAIF